MQSQGKCNASFCCCCSVAANMSDVRVVEIVFVKMRLHRHRHVINDEMHGLHDAPQHATKHATNLRAHYCSRDSRAIRCGNRLEICTVNDRVRWHRDAPPQSQQSVF